MQFPTPANAYQEIPWTDPLGVKWIYKNLPAPGYWAVYKEPATNYHSAAVRVAGTLTSDGSTELSFADMVYLKDAYGYPSYGRADTAGTLSVTLVTSGDNTGLYHWVLTDAATGASFSGPYSVLSMVRSDPSAVLFTAETPATGAPAISEVDLTTSEINAIAALPHASTHGATGSDPLTPKAIAVTGALTRNGSAAVVFPVLQERSTYAFRPLYADDTSAYQALYETGRWKLKKSGGGVWQAAAGTEASPDLAASWAAVSPATGTPTVGSADIVTAQSMEAAAWVHGHTADEIEGVSPVEDVTVYGAIGNGVANDTAAIHAAIAASVVSRKDVYIPKGVYKCNITINTGADNVKIFGDGQGSISDWNEGTDGIGPATKLIPANDAVPIVTIKNLHGVSISRLAIVGNGADTSVCGILVDLRTGDPVRYIGSGLFCDQMVVRKCTDNIWNRGGCNVYFKNCALMNGTRDFYGQSLAHSIVFDNCCIGGAANTGDSLGLKFSDGSFVTILACELGNCTKLLHIGPVYYDGYYSAAQVTIINSNIESITGGHIIELESGSLHQFGGRIGVVDETSYVRVNSATGFNVMGVTLTGVNFYTATDLYPRVIFEHNGGYPNPVISQCYGDNLSVREWDATFASVRSTTPATGIADMTSAEARAFAVAELDMPRAVVISGTLAVGGTPITFPDMALMKETLSRPSYGNVSTGNTLELANFSGLYSWKLSHGATGKFYTCTTYSTLAKAAYSPVGLTFAPYTYGAGAETGTPVVAEAALTSTQIAALAITPSTIGALAVSGSMRTAYVAKTATYAVIASDHTIECTSGTFTVTLPTAAGIGGTEYTIKNSGAGVITAATTSSQTIDGETSQTLIQWDSLTAVSNGTNWIVT